MALLKMKHNNATRKALPYLIIIAVVGIAYGTLWPGFFSLRNDQINYFLPVRMYMSDAFRNHEFILWNPFMSGSYPLHSDIQGPCWNPFAIVLAWLFKYNMTVLCFEFLLYYIIGGIGCYLFARNFSSNWRSGVAIAVCYACSGFAISSVEYMSWVGSIAFVPFVAHFFYLLLKKPSFYTSIRLALSLWLLLVCGYPSFLICLGYICVAAMLVYIVKLYQQNRTSDILQICKYGAMAFLLFVLVSLPAIHSFAEYLSYYARGQKAALEQINAERFSWAYPLSLLFPGDFLAVVKTENIGYVDYDSYIGLLPIIVLFVGIKKAWPTSLRDRFLVSGSIFVFVFTLGSSTPLRLWCADYVPLLGKFGFSHNLRIFLMLALFIWLAPRLDDLFSRPTSFFIRKIRIGALVAGAIISVYVLLVYQKDGFENEWSRLLYLGGLGWQLLLLVSLLVTPRRFLRANYFLALILLDMIVSVNAVLPTVGLSRTPHPVYNQYAKQFYATKPDLLHPVLVDHLRTVDDYYNTINATKSIPRKNFPSNTRSEAYVKYLADSNNYKKLLSLPFAFSNNGTLLDIEKIDLGYNYINIDVLASDSCQLVMQQVYYSRWRSRNKETAISAYDNVLLQGSLKKGMNHIRLYYYKNDLIWESVFSICMLLFLSVMIFIGYRKPRHRY